MSRCIKLNQDEIKNLNLKYKILGNNPYKCVVAAFETAGFQKTNGIFFNFFNF
jgi:hypothetical protein